MNPFENKDEEESNESNNQSEKISTYGFYKNRVNFSSKKGKHFIVKNKKEFKKRNTKKIFNKNPFGFFEQMFQLFNPSLHHTLEISFAKSISLFLIFLLIPLIYNIFINFEKYESRYSDNFLKITLAYDNLKNTSFLETNESQEYISNSIIQNTKKSIIEKHKETLNSFILSFSKNLTFFTIIFIDFFISYFSYLIIAILYFFVILITLLLPKILFSFRKKKIFKRTSFAYSISLKHLIKAFNISSIYLSIHLCFDIKETLLFIFSLAIFMVSTFISYFTIFEEEIVNLEEEEDEEQ
ncbi:MAG: hypothetical protein QW210_00650 [Candidatus Woesearchaeota archaeon]